MAVPDVQGGIIAQGASNAFIMSANVSRRDKARQDQRASRAVEMSGRLCEDSHGAVDRCASLF